MRGGGDRFTRKPSRRTPSPAESQHGWAGPYARAAQIGGEQGEWSWVSYRGRKALGPEQRRQNGQGRATDMEGEILQGAASWTGMVMIGTMFDHAAENDGVPQLLGLGFSMIMDVDGLLHTAVIDRFRVLGRWQ
ncbi:hypothetical protein A2U01_0037324 [Trifolium medium]|uniref:Uncharacterized protein n=1 Tax=Trifolium medium TaxID=97028 RepID=A0A392PX16_9FABA|nr:hypothetical protein [Trifolium medium]